jgi:hypothetical protein
MNDSQQISVQLLRVTSRKYATMKRFQKIALEINHSNESSVQLLEMNLRKCFTLE